VFGVACRLPRLQPEEKAGGVCALYACMRGLHCVSSMPIVADRPVFIFGDERECVCFGVQQHGVVAVPCQILSKGAYVQYVWCVTSVHVSLFVSRTCVSFCFTCSPSLGAQALRSVEVNDPAAGEKANREFIVDESDCPYFKLGVIQALRYRNPSVLFGDDCETGWMKQVRVFNAQLHCEEPICQYLLR